MDLALNDLKWLICHQIKPNQTKPAVTNDDQPNPTKMQGNVENIDKSSIYKWIMFYNNPGRVDMLLDKSNHV